MSKLRTVAQHTPGQSRFLTYYLEFPDGDVWWDQVQFVHDLQFELKNTSLLMGKNIPLHVKHDVARKGEATWQDNNSVKHIIRVEDTKRNRNWGVRK